MNCRSSIVLLLGFTFAPGRFRDSSTPTQQNVVSKKSVSWKTYKDVEKGYRVDFPGTSLPQSQVTTDTEGRKRIDKYVGDPSKDGQRDLNSILAIFFPGLRVPYRVTSLENRQ